SRTGDSGAGRALFRGRGRPDIGFPRRAGRNGHGHALRVSWLTSFTTQRSRPRHSSGRPLGLVIPAKAGTSALVIPAKAGIHLLPTDFLLSSHPETDNMDSRFRGNDESLARFRGNDAFPDSPQLRSKYTCAALTIASAAPSTPSASVLTQRWQLSTQIQSRPQFDLTHAARS